MRFYGFGLVLSTLALGALAAACADEAPGPGFEEVGGSGEGAGGPSTTGSGTTKTTGSSSPTSSTSSTTGNTTSSTTGGSTSSGPTCNDLGPGEPNDTESTAHDLGTIGDCDDDDGGNVSGMLDGSGDPDWYKYLGTDGTGCLVDPDRSITSSHPVRLCKYIQCLDNEENDFECPDGTTSSTSPDGRPGCCGTTSMDISLTCGSSSINADDAVIYIRVDTTENACVSYTLTYAY